MGLADQHTRLWPPCYAGQLLQMWRVWVNASECLFHSHAHWRRTGRWHPADMGQASIPCRAQCVSRMPGPLHPARRQGPLRPPYYRLAHLETEQPPMGSVAGEFLDGGSSRFASGF